MQMQLMPIVGVDTRVDLACFVHLDMYLALFYVRTSQFIIQIEIYYCRYIIDTFTGNSELFD